MMKNGVAVTGLTVVRGGVPVLDDVSFEIPAGEVTGLLGPSGCGKSTLMRTIVGVQRITSGTVTVFGESAGAASLRSRIGYVTQAPSVYDDLTVAENLRYFATVVGAPRADVDRVLDEVDLTAAAGSRADQLSGGQRSRVSLAVALLGTPRLLVLDEPTVGLDPVLRRELWDLFARLAAAGTTLFVSSHVMDEATRCDRLVLMREGAVLADSPLDELLERTEATDAEAAFLALVERSAA